VHLGLYCCVVLVSFDDTSLDGENTDVCRLLKPCVETDRYRGQLFWQRRSAAESSVTARKPPCIVPREEAFETLTTQITNSKGDVISMSPNAPAAFMARLRLYR